MKWENLLRCVADEPGFTSGFLMSPHVSREALERQLSRWTKAGKLHQLRRGLYVLAEPYRKTVAEPFLLANLLRPASYVSLQSALAHVGMIPEYVPTVTSVTTGRPGTVETPFGVFSYRHVKKAFFWGYRKVDLAQQQAAFLATPEKALLDLIYLTPGADDRAYLQELRLQNLSQLELDRLRQMAQASASPKLSRAVEQIVQIVENEEYEAL